MMAAGASGCETVDVALAGALDECGPFVGETSVGGEPGEEDEVPAEQSGSAHISAALTATPTPNARNIFGCSVQMRLGRTGLVDPADAQQRLAGRSANQKQSAPDRIICEIL
ncbi:hypothetical protein [Mycobacterium basiliense]|uniref:hypothetical protein n=1 Tax=Mycobacterium basiliense TaxID=2094119 RepID=UPI0013019100|nr:hypothetical protein [Mycobacterium basiliense]